MDKEQLGSVIEMMRDDMIDAHAEMTVSTEHLRAVLDALEAALARAEGGKSLYVVMERHPNGSLRHLFHHIRGERFLEVYVGERLAEDLAEDWCRGPSWSRSGNRYFEAHPFESEEAQSALRTATEPRP